MTDILSNHSFSPNFVSIYNDCMDSRMLDHSEYVVFATLKSHCDKNLITYMSYRHLEFITGLTKSTVIEKIKSLRKKGVISIQKRLSEDGSYLSNRYIIHDFNIMWENETDENSKQNIISLHNALSGNISDILADNKNRQFVKFPYAVIKSDLTTHAKIIYLNLLKYYNHVTRECFPSIRTLAKSCGYCMATVRAAIKELVSKKFIKVESRFTGSFAPGKKGKQTSNQYEFLPITNNNGKPEVTDTEYKPYSEATTEIITKVTTEVDPNWSDTGFIREYYDFDVIESECKRLHYGTTLINPILNVLHEVLNTPDHLHIQISGAKIKAKTVKAVYEKLTWMNILYVINKYNQVTDDIKNPLSYIRSMLYKSQAQQDADIQNQINHDFPEFH